MENKKQEIADIGLMLETALGYLSTPQVSDEEAKKAEHHIEVAQRMLIKLVEGN